VIVHHHASALGGGPPGQRGADAAARAGDHCPAPTDFTLSP
jgi:hypothetical protein